jgi:hypothetical protein
MLNTSQECCLDNLVTNQSKLMMIIDDVSYDLRYHWLERRERSEVRDNYYILCSGLCSKIQRIWEVLVRSAPTTFHTVGVDDFFSVS